MTDQTIKEAFLALSEQDNLILESHLALMELISNRLPDLTPEEKELLKSAIHRDKKKLQTLKDKIVVLQ